MTDDVVPQTASQWVHLRSTEVAAHPLYGMGGWLAVFLLLQLAGLIYLGFTQLRGLALLLGHLGSFFQADPIFAGLIVLIVPILLLSVCMLLLGYARNPRFRSVALWTLGLTLFWHVAMLGYFGSVAGSLDSATLFGEIIQLLIVASIWTYYFLSRRVRVTYLWQVQRDDPYLATLRRAPVEQTGSAS